jgi:hypothetical protein
MFPFLNVACISSNIKESKMALGPGDDLTTVPKATFQFKSDVISASL